MNLEFDLDSIENTEFGVGIEESNDSGIFVVPVDECVQLALQSMTKATWQAAQGLSASPSLYDPSEKYESFEFVYLPLDDAFAKQMRDLHQANNIRINADALSKPDSIFHYFARMTDKKGRRLTVLRRASQFKGLLKSRLIRLLTDAITLVEGNIFKLDNDFDLLIDSEKVYVLRPSGFEFVAQLKEAVLAAVPANIKVLQQDLDFLDFSNIQDYACKHPRAARYLASIRSQNEAKNIDKDLLKKRCIDTGLEIHESNGKLSVDTGNIMDFLEVLDRRRYEVELVKGSLERFKAPSRKKINS
jgi:hypothetical protein